MIVFNETIDASNRHALAERHVDDLERSLCCARSVISAAPLGQFPRLFKHCSP